MKLTRRRLASALLNSAATAALAQTAPPATPEDELKAARDRLRATASALSLQELPMSTEPAFQFKP